MGEARQRRTEEGRRGGGEEGRRRGGEEERRRGDLFFFIYSIKNLPNIRLTLPYYRDDTPGSNVLVNPGTIT